MIGHAIHECWIETVHARQYCLVQTRLILLRKTGRCDRIAIELKPG